MQTHPEHMRYYHHRVALSPLAIAGGPHRAHDVGILILPKEDMIESRQRFVVPELIPGPEVDVAAHSLHVKEALGPGKSGGPQPEIGHLRILFDMVIPPGMFAEGAEQ